MNMYRDGPSAPFQPKLDGEYCMKYSTGLPLLIFLSLLTFLSLVIVSLAVAMIWSIVHTERRIRRRMDFLEEEFKHERKVLLQAFLGLGEKASTST